MVKIYWNHRVMKTARSTNNPAWANESEFVVAEVYYDSDTDEIEGWAIGSSGENDDSPGMRPWGVDLEELRWSLESMLAACDKPWLDEAALLEIAERKLDSNTGES